MALIWVEDRPDPQPCRLFYRSEKGVPHHCHFLDRELCISARWVQSSSNYESLEGSEKKHQGHLTTFTALQIIIYSSTEHFLCGDKRHRTYYPF